MTDWTKLAAALDFAGRAGTINRAMDAAEAKGSVPVGGEGDGNPDLNVPYTIQLRNLYTSRRDSLLQQARDAIAQA